MNPLRRFVVAGLLSGCGATAPSAEPASEAAGAPVAETATPAPDATGSAREATPPVEPVAPQPERANTGGCTADADCSPYQCSRSLWLCYDEPTGYVWDAHQHGDVGGWSQPPRYFDDDGDGMRDADCAQGHVFWPKVNRCYDPSSGYTFNQALSRWEYFGDWYTEGEDSAEADAGAPGAADSGTIR